MYCHFEANFGRCYRVKLYFCTTSCQLRCSNHIQLHACSKQGLGTKRHSQGQQIIPIKYYSYQTWHNFETILNFRELLAQKDEYDMEEILEEALNAGKIWGEGPRANIANVQSQKEQEKEAWSPLRRPALLLLQLRLRLCRCSIIITLVGLESCRLLQFHDRFWSCKLFFRDTSGEINTKNSVFVVSVNKMALEASIFAADKLLLQSCRVLEF